LHKYGLRMLTVSIPENTLFAHFETRRAFWRSIHVSLLTVSPKYFLVALVSCQAHPIRTTSSLFRCSPN
jgi:hypothetical protein